MSYEAIVELAITSHARATPRSSEHEHLKISLPLQEHVIQGWLVLLLRSRQAVLALRLELVECLQDGLLCWPVVLAEELTLRDGDDIRAVDLDADLEFPLLAAISFASLHLRIAHLRIRKDLPDEPCGCVTLLESAVSVFAKEHVEDRLLFGCSIGHARRAATESQRSVASPGGQHQAHGGERDRLHEHREKAVAHE